MPYRSNSVYSIFLTGHRCLLLLHRVGVRKEKERLADKLEVLGPHTQSQDTEDFMAKLDMPDVDFTSSLNDVTNQVCRPVKFVHIVPVLSSDICLQCVSFVQ